MWQVPAHGVSAAVMYQRSMQATLSMFCAPPPVVADDRDAPRGRASAEAKPAKTSNGSHANGHKASGSGSGGGGSSSKPHSKQHKADGKSKRPHGSSKRDGDKKGGASEQERKADFVRKLCRTVRDELKPRLAEGVIATRDDFKVLAR